MMGGNKEGGGGGGSVSKSLRQAAKSKPPRREAWHHAVTSPWGILKVPLSPAEALGFGESISSLKLSTSFYVWTERLLLVGSFQAPIPHCPLISNSGVNWIDLLWWWQVWGARAPWRQAACAMVWKPIRNWISWMRSTSFFSHRLEAIRCGAAPWRQPQRVLSDHFVAGEYDIHRFQAVLLEMRLEEVGVRETVRWEVDCLFLVISGKRFLTFLFKILGERIWGVGEGWDGTWIPDCSTCPPPIQFLSPVVAWSAHIGGEEKVFR